jgi:hypothetical protein
MCVCELWETFIAEHILVRASDMGRFTIYQGGSCPLDFENKAFGLQIYGFAPLNLNPAHVKSKGSSNLFNGFALHSRRVWRSGLLTRDFTLRHSRFAITAAPLAIREFTIAD